MTSSALAGVHLLKVHKGQAIVARSTARFRVVCAGRRWGKTRGSAIELFKAATKKAKSLIWYVAPSYTMARDIMWDQLIELIPKRLIKKKNETKLSIKLINGATIQLKGADKPDSLRGRGVDFVVLDEYQDFKPGTWEKVIYPTLADKRGRALVIGTPKSYNHFYDLYMKGQDTEKNPDWASWQFPTITSPFIPKSEIDAARENLDEKTFKQEFEASFETMSGRVYYPFSRKTHVGNYPFDPRLPVLVGQDFNVDPMCSAIMQYHQKTGEIWIVDEIFRRSSNTDEVADELERLYWKHFAAKKIALYPDPAGKQRSSARGESDLQIFKEKGINHIYFRKKHPPVADRVNAVNSMLQSATGRIRLRVNSTCKNVIQSLEQTVYLPNSREVDKRHGAEHMADAVGYPMEYLFPVSKFKMAGVSR